MKTQEVKVGNCVEIMMINISYVIATTRGVVVQGSGATKNGLNLIKQIFLVNFIEFFDSMSLVCFPVIRSGHQCKFGCKEHAILISLCNIMTLKYFVSVSFQFFETEYRLQKLDVVYGTTDPVEHKEVEIARNKIIAASVPTYEAKYGGEDSDNRNDKAE